MQGWEEIFTVCRSLKIYGHVECDNFPIMHSRSALLHYSTGKWYVLELNPAFAGVFRHPRLAEGGGGALNAPTS